MERRDDKRSPRKPLADSHNYKIVEDSKLSAELKPIATGSVSGNSYVPLKDINNKSVQEYMSSLEKAQKKWVENAKSWPVEDELQNAQLQWLNEISMSGPKFLCTSTPQPKKRPASYKLPWSPPKSSADIDPRRGVCVYYKPTTKPKETKEYIDEKGYNVKVAQLEEERPKVFKSKMPEGDKKYVLDHRFPNPGDVPKSFEDLPPQARKRYITVRKRLERIAKPKPLKVNTRAEEEIRKPNTSPVTHLLEKEATREYMLKKRAERERLLEEQRMFEAKALEEKKARMERLRETQLRLIKNSMKKPLETTLKPGDALEAGPSRRSTSPQQIPTSEFHPHQDPRSVETDRSPSPSSRFSERTSTGETSLNIQQEKTEELEPPYIRDVDLNHPAFKLILDKDVPATQKLALYMEVLEDTKRPRKQVSPDTQSLDEHTNEGHSPYNLSPSRCDKYNLTYNKNDRSSLISSSTVSPKHSSTTPLHSSPSSSRNSTSSKQGVKKQDSISRSCSEQSLSSSNKENHMNLETFHDCQNRMLFGTVGPERTPVQHGTTARPYNMMMAIANKRAVLLQHKIDVVEQLKKNALEKQALESSGKNQNHNRGAIKKTELNEIKPRKHTKKEDVRNEKGVQCVEGDENRRPSVESFSAEFRETTMDLSGINFAQSERLQKPNVVLMPARISDPFYPHSHSQLFKSQEEINPMCTTAENDSIFQNLKYASIDPPIDTVNNPPDEASSLCYQSSTNSKGRPFVKSPTLTFQENSYVDHLSVPRELSLITSEAGKTNENKGKKHRKRKGIRNITLSEPSPTNYLGLPSPFNRSPVLGESCFEEETQITKGTDEFRNREHPKSSSDHSVIAEEANDSRDSRIENEIRKLESFNDSITSVIEKKKTVLSQNIKSSCEESSILEKTLTSSTVNNDLHLEMSHSSLHGGNSSSSLELPGDDVSGTSIAKFSLKMFTEILKDEDLRSSHQASLFKMKESTITEKAKAEIGFLDLEKKKLKQAGNEEGLRNIRKKVRGIIIKLEQDLDELNRVRRQERNSYRERRQKLVEKINALKIQLKAQSEIQNKIVKDASNISNSTNDSKKHHVTDRRGSDRSIFEKKKRELERKEMLLAEKLSELENISSWKQRLEDGEKRIQELEARLKLQSSQAQWSQRENETQGLVERGTSPFRQLSDESQGERQKAEGSYSDTFDQASSSSAHERLEGKDARKMMAIKVPLSPQVTLKRRHSSGSDESLLFSQTETQSEASDMEVRVLALQQQLKQRKAKLETLHKEYKKSQRERLIAKEQSLLSQIQAYDLYIEQVKKELEKEKEVSAVKIVRPLIKQPKLVSERRKSDTWLIQDRDKHDISKHSSSFLVSSSACFGSPLRDFKSSKQEKTSFNLDTKSIERLSLKSKLSLKSSFSDSNLLQDGEEPLVQAKVSHSSTESCESDPEKQQFTKESIPEKCNEDAKESVIFNQENSSPTTNEIQLSHLKIGTYESVSVKSLSDTVDASEAKPDIPMETSQLMDMELDESEDNTLTQGSIVCKLDNNFEGVQCHPNEENSVEEQIIHKSVSQVVASEKSISEEIEDSVKAAKEKSMSEEIEDSVKAFIEKSISEEIPDSAKATAEKSISEEILDSAKATTEKSISDEIQDSAKVTTEKSISEEIRSSVKISSEKSVSEEIEDSLKITSHSSHLAIKPLVTKNLSEINNQEKLDLTKKSYSDASIVLTSKEVLSKHTDKSLPEEITENISLLKSETTIEEIPESLPSEQDASLMSNNRTESPKNLKSTVSEASNLGLQTKTGSVSIQSSAVTEDIQESENVQFCAENEKESIEESFREVTYLEVSDHVISEVADENESGEKSSPHEADYSHKTPIAEKPDEEFLSSQKERSSEKLSSKTVEDIVKSMISFDEVEEQLSRNTSAELSDFSFPLPTTKVISALADKSPEKNVSVSDNTCHSKSLVEINDSKSVVSDASRIESRKEHSSSEVDESIHTEISNQSAIEAQSDNSNKTLSAGDKSSSYSQVSKSNKSIEIVITEEKTLSAAPSEIIDGALESQHENQSSKQEEEEEEGGQEIIEGEQSFSEMFEESGAKSPFDDSKFEDISVGELSDIINNFNNSNDEMFEQDEECKSHSDANDSYYEEKLSEENIYNVKTPLHQHMWNRETDMITPGAPLIEALQREGGSALDVVWRDIAETAVEEATDLVVSTYIKRKNLEVDLQEELECTQSVGDNEDEEWRREKLSQQQAEAEAEILRLQQLRIDKEIEELEEEEARQFFYVRAIPDKPPPPYTPRRSSLVASVVEAAGEIWSGQTLIPTSFMPGSHLREFIWDLAVELVQRVNPPPPPTNPPWVKSKRRRPRKPIRTKEQLLEEVEKEAKIYLGVEEREVRENLIIRWSRKRRDHVDEILVRESQEEEWEWTDFTEEENIIKNRISDMLIQDAITSATVAIAQAFDKKFKDSC